MPKGAVSGDTYSIRHVQGSYYLPARGYFNVHLTEAQGGLGFLGLPLHPVRLPLHGSLPIYNTVSP